MTNRSKTTRFTLAALGLTLTMAGFMAAHAQSAAPAGAAPASGPQPWKFKTKKLDRAEVDALLAHPDKLVVIDVRRPDEQIKYGSFPVFLSIQNSELAKNLSYIPKGRTILTVSNHAVRAGAAGDLLASKGYKVAGAAGAEDYSSAGGTAVVKIQPPPASGAQ